VELSKKGGVERADVEFTLEDFMKLTRVALAFLVGPLSSVQAAVQYVPVVTHPVIYENGARRVERVRPSMGFRLELISDQEGVKPESFRHGKPFVTATPDERYAVRLYNPLPVRVAVNLTVDGLNSITGKPSGIADGEKWMIDPYGTLTLRGWQVNGEESRRFFFTAKPKSYAKWAGDRMGKDLSANCGVIGAAFFWSQQELDAYYEAHAQVRDTRLRCSPAASMNGVRLQDVASESLAGAAPAPLLAKEAEKKEKAGTGMGERESNPTVQVAFNYDRGMYKAKEAVVIYYDFAPETTPNPFPALSYAPEMP